MILELLFVRDGYFSFNNYTSFTISDAIMPASHRAYSLCGQARMVNAYGHPKTAAVSSLLASQRC